MRPPDKEPDRRYQSADGPAANRTAKNMGATGRHPDALRQSSSGACREFSIGANCPGFVVFFLRRKA